VAGVAHLKAGQRLDVRVHRRREAPQQPGPVLRCHAPPRLESAVRAADPLVNLFAAGQWHRFHDRLVDRADHVERRDCHRAPLSRRPA